MLCVSASPSSLRSSLSKPDALRDPLPRAAAGAVDAGATTT